MNTDNLTFVNFCTVTEEQLTAILQTEQRETRPLYPDR